MELSDSLKISQFPFFLLFSKLNETTDFFCARIQRLTGVGYFEMFVALFLFFSVFRNMVKLKGQRYQINQQCRENRAGENSSECYRKDTFVLG